MTANRAAPTYANSPGNTMDGTTYADRIAEELTALYLGRVNQVTSVGGSANAITGVCTPPLTAAPAHGETFRLTPGANNTSTVTVNLDGTGAIALVDEDGAALAADAIIADRPVTFWYDSGLAKFRVVGTDPQGTYDAAVAAAAAAAMFELIDDIDITSAATNFETAPFTVGRYAKLVYVAVGISVSNNNVSLTIDLRSSSGVVLTTGALGGGVITAASTNNFSVEYLIDDEANRHSGMYWGFTTNSTIISPTAIQNNAASPDRVRITVSANNIDAGRIFLFGMRKEP